LFMPRRGRLTVPGVPLHLIQRGNNRQAIFFEEMDFRVFLGYLVEGCLKSDVQVHAYALMTNHLHLLVSSASPDGPGKLMQSVCLRYTQWVNRKCNRTGTLWEGRYRSCPTQQETYFLACSRYIELNPVRAGMVNHPAAYPWTSYRANAHGENNSLVKPHPVYDSLGPTPETRQEAYRGLFENDLEPELLTAIRKATNGNFALGNKVFSQKMAEILGKRTEPGTPGRPKL
jgi:putative transposase